MKLSKKKEKKRKEKKLACHNRNIRSHDQDRFNQACVRSVCSTKYFPILILMREHTLILMVKHQPERISTNTWSKYRQQQESDQKR